MFNLARNLLIGLFCMFAYPFGIFGQGSTLSNNVVAMTHRIIANHQTGIVGYNQISELDTIFRQSKDLCDDSYSEALITLTFACLPFRAFAVRIPVVKAQLMYNVYSADSATFERKNDFLPNNVYFDSPKSRFGDKDKLAHFFGAAFLGYVTGSVNIPDYIGCLVEVFEEVFKVDSSIDLRDVRTNKLGGRFGRMLRKKPEANPSMYFSFYNLTNMIR